MIYGKISEIYMEKSVIYIKILIKLEIFVKEKFKDVIYEDRIFLLRVMI